VTKVWYETEPPAGPPIAIIGMAGRFPMADDVEEFWRNISVARECLTDFSDEELLAAGESPRDIAEPNYIRRRGVLNDIRGADAGFFGISPREATLADPQQLIFSEIVWEALEYAGYAVPEHRGTVGVFAGMNISTYLLTRPNALRMGVATDGLMVGNDKDALATNVAYRLDLRGPSVSVQTFCSTSLVAVHMACASVRRGECDIAIAGGVSIRVPDRIGYLYHEGDQASSDGHVRTFDAAAKGTVYGDGAAVVALKRLDQAMADRDTVFAVLRGSAINNDGSQKFSFQAPSIDGQRRCISAAIRNAGVDPNDISYVEAHGTATEVGDPMEVAALTGAFGPDAGKKYCLLGSTKPCVGHLDRASGATGLIKVVQSLRHELIPGTGNFSTPNPEIDFDNSPFRVTAEPTPWPRVAGRPRTAGLSSLGTGGTNVHAVISEAPEPAARPARTRRWQILPLSARSKAAVEASCERTAAWLSQNPQLDAGDVAFTLQVGRKLFHHRRIVVADSAGRAAELFADPARRLGRGDATVGRRVGFLIAGVAEQYPGMVAALYADEPTFRADVDACLAVLGLDGPAQVPDLFVPARRTDAPSGPDLAALLGRGAPAARAVVPEEQARLVQPAVFVAEYAVARLLMRWGLRPEIMIGYSLGEYVAACLSGVLSLRDALRLVAYRAELIAALPGGAMLAVVAAEDQLPALLGDALADLDVAVRTGSQLVLAGPGAAVERAAALLRAAEIPCRPLETTHAYHSRMLEPAAARLSEWIASNVTLNAPQIPYISNVTGGPVTAELVADPGYWARHMCGTVEFGAGLGRLLAAGEFALAEIGAGKSLGALARAHPDCGTERWPLIVATLPGEAEQADPNAALAEAVGRLWLTGVPVDWPALHGVEQESGDEPGAEGSDTPTAPRWLPGRVPLPTYPFERQEYWLEANLTGFGGGPAPIDENDPVSVLTGLPKLPEGRWINVPTWRQATRRPRRPAAATWLVLTDRGAPDALAGPLRAHWEAAGAPVVFVRPGDRLDLGVDGEADPTVRPGSTEDAVALFRALAKRGRTPDRIVHLWTVGGSASDPDRSRELGLDALIAIARAAGEVGLESWSLDLVTESGQRVLDGDPLRPRNALLLGPCRVVPIEYPGVRTRIVDLEAVGLADARPPAGLAGRLAAELDGEPADQIVALRGGRRWIPGFDVLDEAVTAGVPPAAEFRRGGVYLVTGGLGGIGLALAERIHRDHRARLVLLGRTPVPPRDQWNAILASDATGAEVRRRLDGLHRLANAGAEVTTVAGDVSKAEDVQRAVRTAIEQYGRLDGVVHCSGVPAVGLIQFKTTADLDRVLAPKVAGAEALVEALRGVPLDFLALFSSNASATGGGAGQVDYCSANSYLDAFAASDPLPGTLVTSIGWGEWTWSGWTAGLDGLDEGTRAFFQEYRQEFGIGFEEGWRSLERILAVGEPHVYVSTQDFEPLVALSRRNSVASQLAVVKRARDAIGRHPRPELSTPYSEPQTPEEETIAQLWSEALGLEQVGVHDNFFDLGGNSLIGMEIIAAARKALGVADLPPHLLYQAPTVAALAAEAVAGARREAEGGLSDEAAQAADAVEAELLRSRIEQRRSMLSKGRRA
jgi:acyl transferase domain-containing protein